MVKHTVRTRTALLLAVLALSLSACGQTRPPIAPTAIDSGPMCYPDPTCVN